MLESPVLVEVVRGTLVESFHRGSIAIVDSKGREIVALGDVARPIFPRSAIKPLQALYLVESGAVDAFHLTKSDLALGCASHSGDGVHTKGVEAMLQRAGQSLACLECGAQWPTSTRERAVLMQQGAKPAPVHNNCSGKHAAFICATHHLGEKIAGYVKPDHPAQREIRGLLEGLYSASLADERLHATDGCSIPTYAVGLKPLALAMARFGARQSGSSGRDKAMQRIYEACVSHPQLVAGEGRFDTTILSAFEKRVLVKTGAEGVYAASVPELGIGIALKCDDGTTRASETMMAACLAALFKDQPDALRKALHVSLKNRNGWTIGHMRPVDGLLDKLRI